MEDTPSLPRRPREPEATDFDALRAEGIRWLERLTGEVWSDYNLHDPGITVLEHLCYGLTDVLYRTDFDIADHLTGPSGEIDAARQLLYPPDEILPCRPSTPADHRDRILDEVREVDDVRILPWPWRGVSAADEEGGGPGLYRVVLRPSGRGDDDEPTILRRVHEVLSAARTVGEDVQLVTLAEREVFHLSGDVEIAGARPLTEILSDIYRVAEDHIRGRPADADHDPERIFLADLRTRIRTVDGVAGVRDLRLVPAAPEGEGTAGVTDVLPRFRRVREGAATRWTVPWLAVPGDDTDRIEAAEADRRSVRLWRRGRRLRTPPDFATRYQAARGGHRLRPASRRAGPSTPAYPAGRHRPLGRYRSVQEHFPAIYGVNADGVPEASDEAWLSAYRLTCFMMLSEQVLADHLASLHQLRDLFSVSEEGGGEAPLHPTYRVAPLGREAIPGWDRLFGAGESDAESGAEAGSDLGPWRIDPRLYLPRAIAPHDDAMDRRSRLQDHLLAVFGESFAPRHRRDSGNESANDDPLHMLIRSRARLLREIPAVTRDRAGGADLLAEDGEAAGFHRRVALLLGVPPDADFHVLEHVLLRPRSSFASEEAWRAFYGLRISVVFPGWVGRTRSEAFRRRAEEVVARTAPAHVLATCYWLTEDRMTEFRERTGRWEACRAEWFTGLHAAWAADRRPDATELDAAASDVVRFLHALERAHDG